ncbi:hypothetical protein Patl1_25356 [Pistacia atlantica]|uniref:Uncharacterized protein n=1 Tax=Pistacia atlantica TaxID=434234 RepID=A0ACC1AZH4_9ROSI|nr:hypothetical protein Patl1_25356 [Pistacia atlantica]
MPFHAPNTLAFLFETAVSTHSSSLGRTIHAYIIKTLTSPIPSFLSNHLINMYSKLDLSNSAQLVLQFTPIRSRSVVTWTALISVASLHMPIAGKQVHGLALKAWLDK